MHVDKFAVLVRGKDRSDKDKYNRIKKFFDRYGVASCSATCFIFQTY